jgi:hypothetical protein
MGGQEHYTSESLKICQNTDLAQARDLGIENGESVFQHLAVVWVLGGLELLQYALAGQGQPQLLPLPGNLLRRKGSVRLGAWHCGFRLLFFN